jgi:hypothetical protein
VGRGDEQEKESNKWDAKMIKNPKIIELSLFVKFQIPFLMET